MRLKNQLVVAAENTSRDQIVSFICITTMFKDKKEQMALVHKVIDPPDRKLCVTLPRDKPESSYAQQNTDLKSKHDEFTNLPNVWNSVYNQRVANQAINILLQKVTAIFYSFLLFYLFD